MSDAALPLCVYRLLELLDGKATPGDSHPTAA
jgi:hypothetical protein